MIRAMTNFNVIDVNGVPTIEAEELHAKMGVATLIDVRRPDEYDGELGHIPGATLVNLERDIPDFLQKGDKSKPIVFVCRSGARSGSATKLSRQMGYTSTVNLAGGMIRWNELSFEVER